MTDDTREDILEYLFMLLKDISGVVTVWRNRGDLPEKNPQTGVSQRPAVILLDGDDRLMQKSEEVYIRKSVRMPPAIAVVSPQIFIVLDAADDRSNTTFNGLPYNVGEVLSQWRLLIKGAIENDSGLISLLTTTGQIVYLGFDTDMKTGSTIGALGPMGMLKYDFYYPLRPPND
jgi:hypothetical protein